MRVDNNYRSIIGEIKFAALKMDVPYRNKIAFFKVATNAIQLLEDKETRKDIFVTASKRSHA